MRIPKNSWHYRVWKFTYAFRGKEGFETPEQTNLCRYMSRTILYPVPIFLAIIALFVVMGGLVFVLPNIATILVGYGTLAMSGGQEMYRHRPFPRISVRGRTIPMWAIVSPTWLLVALVMLVAFFPSQTGTAGIYAAYGIGGVTVGVLALYALYLFIATIVSACRQWEGLDVAKEYIQAKKRRLCPVITFDESEHQSSTV
ncbi:MAG: hypothetical protein HY001_01495 [Candidatus Portnoybacteria bacterium]|nr:hypothetical protein [Candidatus Portnoybacteria bacterium]